MPDRLTSRTVLAVLLLLLTIAGVRVAGPAVGTNPPGMRVAIGVGAGLEAVLAALLIALRWRPSGTAGPAVRLRGLLTGVIATLLIAIPAAILVAGLAHRRPRRRLPVHHPRPGGRLGKLHLGRTGHAAPWPDYVQYVLIAVLVAALVVTAILIWRRRRHWARTGRTPVTADEETDTPAELARAVDSARLALRELDDARAAIIGCYLAMEDSLAEAGAARGQAETPDELLARAVEGGLVSAPPAGRLTALFYEARFSTHPMPPSRRDEAERALAGIAASLTTPDLARLPAGDGAVSDGPR